MEKPDYMKAHKHSFKSRKEIEGSNKCGCFHCLAIFDSSEIDDCIDEADGAPQTPLCPKCGIDSVIGDKSGYPITKQFLKKMKNYFFW
jgi:NAD-dependent SIR2 family protein deacetylase